MIGVNYIGHATVLIDIGRLRVLTDPFLRDSLFLLQRHGARPAAEMLTVRPPDLVLLSHLHYDHTDLPSLRRLPAGTPVVAPRGSGRYLARRTAVEVHEIAEGECLQVADVQVSAVPADHGHRLRDPRPATPCLGYALCNHSTVYFAGDTGLFPEMEAVGSRFDLDLALLPVWGYGHRLGRGHLTPLTAAQALEHLRPRVAVPIHWGALRYPGPAALWKRAVYLSEPPHAFARHAAALAPRTEVRVLQPGQATTVW